MKKISAIFMAVTMMMLCVCGNNATGQDSKSADDNGQTEVRQEETDTAEESEMNAAEGNDAENTAVVPLPEEFILVQGGVFQMGSPEEEAWRSEDEVNFSGKMIIPFCSHGGGRFGQSLTAIAKLVPDAEMGEALSVHYSGGSDLPDEITEWLKTNEMLE